MLLQDLSMPVRVEHSPWLEQLFVILVFLGHICQTAAVVFEFLKVCPNCVYLFALVDSSSLFDISGYYTASYGEVTYSMTCGDATFVGAANCGSYYPVPCKYDYATLKAFYDGDNI